MNPKWCFLFSGSHPRYVDLGNFFPYLVAVPLSEAQITNCPSSISGGSGLAGELMGELEEGIFF